MVKVWSVEDGLAKDSGFHTNKNSYIGTLVGMANLRLVCTDLVMLWPIDLHHYEVRVHHMEGTMPKMTQLLHSACFVLGELDEQPVLPCGCRLPCACVVSVGWLQQQSSGQKIERESTTSSL